MELSKRCRLRPAVDCAELFVAFCLLVCTCCGHLVSGARYNTSVTYVDRNALFQTSVVGGRTGNVFVVAASNCLYQFDAALNVLRRRRTLTSMRNLSSDGPTDCDSAADSDMVDQPATSAPPPPLLLLVPSINGSSTSPGPDGFVLVCVVGLCSVHASSDLTFLQTLDIGQIIGRRSTIVRAFVGASSTVYVRSAAVPLYIASTTSSSNKETLMTSRVVAAVSNLVIGLHHTDNITPSGQQQQQRLEISFRHHRGSTTSSVNIASRQRWSDFFVRYVHGFSYGRFAYFVAVQQNAPAVANSPLVTRLVRFCQTDDSTNSYVELRLECHRRPLLRTGTDLSLGAATAARLSAVSGGGALQDALVVLFDGGSGAHGSRLCSYSMADINRKFTEAQKDCYLGSGELLEWIHPSGDITCRRDMAKAAMFTDDFCSDPAANRSGVDARYPLSAFSLWTSDTLRATTLHLLVQSNKTIALIGSADGRVQKVNVEGGELYANIDVNNNSIDDMSADVTGQHLYVLSKHRITRLAVKSCSLYTDCESCVTSRDSLGCGWCGGRCTNVSHCRTSFNPHFFDNNCCPPVIDRFHPLSGPLNGGTPVTIYGHNFGNGTLIEDGSNMSAAVSIGTTNCSIKFRNASIIVCETGQVDVLQNRDLKLSVKDSSKTTTSVEICGSASSEHQSFAYKEPSITSLSPVIGPKIGGTLITFQGKDLDIGTQLNIQIAGLPCTVVELSSTNVICKTSEWPDFTNYSLTHEIHVTIDGNESITKDTFFTYTDNPVIFGVTPNATFVSGGLTVTVYGSNLHAIQNKNVTFHMNGSYVSQKCITSADSMRCVTRNYSLPSISLLPFEAAIRFDDSHLNLSSVKLIYVADPWIHSRNISCFDSAENFSQLLNIQGENLNLAASIGDYTITIGQHVCNVTHLDVSHLFCLLHMTSTVLASDIQVKVGGLTLNAGHFNCILKNSSSMQAVTVAAMTLLVVAMLVIIFAISCTVFCLKRARRWPFRKRCQMEPNVLYTASLPTERISPLPEQPCTLNSYLTRSLVARKRLARSQTSREPLLDEETRRLLNDSHLLIPRDRLLLLEIIGQGHFGCVLRGFMNFTGEKTELEVAVKTLKSFTECSYTSEVEMRKFLDEALTMREFSDNNVLQLIGIALDGDQPLVILPFMTHGDLLSYIRNENNSPSVKDLMEFGIQIADGMTYLSSLKFVHRDLAARNCMLDDNMVVKVADFGLSRDIYERDYYSSEDRKAKLPVKWMALESLEKGIYSIRTDIWSYGVVLWELMTRGVCPYPEVDNWDIVKYLKSGRRMLKPSYCPDPLYSLMLRCWDVEPARRPYFAELSTSVQTIIHTMQAMSKHRQVGLNVDYVNSDPSRSPNDYLRPSSDNEFAATFFDTSVADEDQAQAAVASDELFRVPVDTESDFMQYMHPLEHQRTSNDDETLLLVNRSAQIYPDFQDELNNRGTVV